MLNENLLDLDFYREIAESRMIDSVDIYRKIGAQNTDDIGGQTRLGNSDGMGGVIYDQTDEPGGEIEVFSGERKKLYTYKALVTIPKANRDQTEYFIGDTLTATEERVMIALPHNADIELDDEINWTSEGKTFKFEVKTIAPHSQSYSLTVSALQVGYA